MSELGELLRRLRGKSSLREASKKTGLSHTYLSIIENGIDLRSGSPVKPTPETLKMISKAYNYPYDKLMEKAGYIDEVKEGKYNYEVDIIKRLSPEKLEKFKEFLEMDEEKQDTILDFIKKMSKD